MIIGKNWKIESDEMNVTLFDRHVRQKDGKLGKKGEERWKEHSYFSTVENALMGLVNIEVNRTGMKNVEEVVAKVKEQGL